jgi:hypothetical protein
MMRAVSRASREGWRGFGELSQGIYRNVLKKGRPPLPRNDGRTVPTGARDASTGGDVHTRFPLDLAVPKVSHTPECRIYYGIYSIIVKNKIELRGINRDPRRSPLDPAPRDPTFPFKAPGELWDRIFGYLPGLAAAHSPTDTIHSKWQAPFQSSYRAVAPVGLCNLLQIIKI